ncbi:MAG: hypothetical protein GY749_27380 [Desulfobacteraceae bacterium]|nr:hypothetical protein [Desulfobacteraceae bacterium]
MNSTGAAIAWVTEETGEGKEVIVKFACPVCGKYHYHRDEMSDDNDLLITDDMEPFGIVCVRCHDEAEEICGDELTELLKEGDLELHEETVREILLLKKGAALILNS